MAKIKRRAVGCIACAVVLASTLGTAAAHNEKYETTLTIKQNSAGSTYKGRAKSDSKSCLKNRKVTLYEEVGGTPEERGSATTNEKGKWKIAFIGDGYYAEVAEKVIERPGHKHTCEPDRSPTTPGPPRR